MRTNLKTVCILVAATAVQAAIVLIPAVPLGIPGEWEWNRHSLSGSLAELLGQLAPSVVGLTALLFTARLGNSRMHRHHMESVGDQIRQRRGPSRAITALLLFALTGASWIWLVTVQRCAPAPHRNLKPLWVLYDPSASGYFHEAVFEMESVSEFLSTYPSRMAEGEVYHVGTHPPGLFLLSRLVVDVCRSAPGLAAKLRQFLPRSDLEAFRTLEARAALNRTLSEPELTALGLLSEFTTLAAALAVIPLYFLIRRCSTALIAWRTACLWPAIPCLAIFLPKSDVLFTLTSASAVTLGAIALASSESMRYRSMLAACSGLILWCGLMMSLAHLPAGLLLAVICGFRVYHLSRRGGVRSGTARRRMKECTGVLAVIVASILVATVLFSVVTGCNMFSVWQMNLANHAAFYDQHTRTAWKWLMVNPLELGLALGLPLAVTAIAGLKRCIRQLKEEPHSDAGTLGLDVALSVLLTVGLLWLSCRNSGEAARLWCFMMPWLTLLAVPVLQAELKLDRVRNSAVVWHTVLVLQTLVSMITCVCVNGFSV